MPRQLIARLAACLPIAFATLTPAVADEPTTEPELSFRIQILDCRWPSDVDGYSNEAVRPQLKVCARKQPLFVVETADIQSYCWDRHSVELTRDVSDRLVAAFDEGTFDRRRWRSSTIDRGGLGAHTLRQP